MKPELLARIFLFLLLAAAGAVGVLVAAPALWLASPLGPQVIELHARMPENGGWSMDALEAEVGKPLHMRMTSDDVLHSFAIGQLDTPPVDLLPGEWQDVTLTFDRPGRYTFYCVRWCGRNHWRMRGTINVTSDAVTSDAVTSNGDAVTETASDEKPLYLRLGLNVDAPHLAEEIPAAPPSSDRGAALAARLPAWALDRQVYLETSPSALWQRLRAEPALADLDGAALWDAVAYLQARQASPEALASAAKRFATNCAACHGESGQGNGVMVEGLPRFDPSAAHVGAVSEEHAGMDNMDQPGEMADTTMGLSAPPDFTDPRVLLGASPALLEGKLLRGGMGTGMPYWGPIFTQDQIDGLIAYLYTFAMQR